LSRNEGSDSRTGESVGCIRVKNAGIKDTRIVVRISTRDLDQVARLWNAIPIASNLKLDTARIELCTTQRRPEMESDDFMADKIVAGGDVLGDLNGCYTSIEKVLLYPVGTVWFPPDLVNLEPLSAGLIELVASDGATGGHVCQHRPNVMWPRAITGRSPVETDSVAWVCICDEGSWTGIGSAGESRVGGAFVGIL
jgi:hypothetical protein